MILPITGFRVIPQRGFTGREFKIIDVARRSRGNEPNNRLRPEAIEAVNTAKSLGTGVAVLSNELELFYGTDVLNNIPLLQEFDHIIDATHSSILNPQTSKLLS